MQPIQAQKEDVKTNMKIMKGNSTFLILLARYDRIILRRQKKLLYSLFGRHNHNLRHSLGYIRSFHDAIFGIFCTI